ncbi:MAG TPA: lipoprotein insertase outer membrane protein LolB [Steroidobacteraceae bacterium]|nr:lipoprotein insertase outer membrane protein LolB [Steroidobacteraceae bacterium]
MRSNTRLPAALMVWTGAALALTLAGCQTVPVAPAPAVAWSVRRPALQTLERFGFNGRVAVAVANQGFNAGLRWGQAGAVTRLTLTGPLGAGGVRVTANGEDLDVVTSNGKRLGNAAARAELEDRLGFEPPIESLRYWVLGVPDPGAPAAVNLDSRQRLTRLTQDGWRIDYGAYMPVGAEWLPRLMTLRRGEVRVRMVVDEWQL